MKIKNNIILVIVISLCFSVSYAKDINESIAVISIDKIMKTLEFLTSEVCEGRLTGSTGYTKAALWCADEFKKMGALPVYQNYLQSFPIAYNETGESSFSVEIPPAKEGGKPEIRTFELQKEYLPLLTSGFGEIEGEIVFAGYGTTAPELGWDDYKGIDVKGKIVAVYYGLPKIEGKDFEPYRNNIQRSENAYKHGAVGMISIFSPIGFPTPNYIEGFPQVTVAESLDDLILQAKGFDKMTIRKLRKNGQEISFATGLKAHIKCSGVHNADATGYNVVAMIPGSDPKLRNEYILIGAHLDHVGKWPFLFPGANDNASGCAIILEIARTFAALDKKPSRSLMFALFGGEESGLHGSRHMVSNLPPAPMKIIQMINFDMNGIGTEICIEGAETYKDMYPYIQNAKNKYSIASPISSAVLLNIIGYFDSDSFRNIGIPVWNNQIKGGDVSGYHKANDTVYFITPKIMQDLIRLYCDALYDFLDR